jgi:hypothetical protein
VPPCPLEGLVAGEDGGQVAQRHGVTPAMPEQGYTAPAQDQVWPHSLPG